LNAVPPELLLLVQRRLEGFYALEPHDPVTDFLIPAEDASGYPGGGSRTLLRQDGDEIAVGVVLEDHVGECLSRADPREHLDRGNLGSFCTMTEEVSHFVYLLFCARAHRTVTELELELQGELDKYLNAVFLLSAQNDGAVSSRLRELLFHEYRLVDDLAPERAARYRLASELAFRYSGYLDQSFLRPRHLPDLAREARRFYRLGQREKLERIRGLERGA
jgi:hypothetical protein